MQRGIGAIISAATAFSLAACVSVPPDNDAAPQERQTAASQPPTPSSAPLRPLDPKSLELREFYQSLQDRLVAQGLLRTDGGGPDTRFDAEDLTRNFIAIALHEEYRTDGETIKASAYSSPLRRWEKPIAMQLAFGASVPLDQRTEDSAEVTKFGAHLSRLTGLAIDTKSDDPNFLVIVANETDRADFRGRIQSFLPGIPPAALNYAMNLPRDQLCLVIGTFDQAGLRYDRAVALIRGEHPTLLRRGCVHEELAQGLGLANDSPDARPSIFNDDEEFGLLTTHDEYLLQILYDPRLKAGMTATEAGPIVRQIAEDILNRPS